MLRAVLSMGRVQVRDSRDSMCYEGEEFPPLKGTQEVMCDFAIIATDEADAQWQPGFYRCGTDLTEMSEAIQS